MKTRNTLLLMALLAALTNFVVAYLSGHSSQTYTFNADQLYLPTLFTDLFSRQGRIADWYLTPAPYFFPDYPLFSLAYWLGNDAYSQVGLYSVIQVVATFAALWLLCRRLSATQGFMLAATAMIGLIWLALMAGEPFSFIMVSASHYGIFITSILFVALWLHLQDNPTPRQRLLLMVVMALLALLSTLSDNLFIVQLVAPLVASTLLLDLANRDASIKSKARLLIPVVFSVLGAAAYGLVIRNDTRYPTSLGVEKLSANLFDLYGVFATSLGVPAYGILFMVYLGVVICLCSNLCRKPAQRRYPDQLSWLALFSLISLCSASTASALVTSLPVVSRYFIAAFSWPVIVVVIFAGHFLKQRLFAVTSALALLAVVSMSWGTYTLVRENGITTHYYPAEVACLDDALERAGATHGISQYWDSKYLQSFSRLKLSMAQHHESLEEMPWITSKKFFRDNYDFAIISEFIPLHTKLTAEPLVRINGAPEKIVTCGARELYLYPANTMRTQKFSTVGHAFQWQACELPTLIGQPAAQCTMQKKDPKQAGYLTYGPYEPLPAGNYAVQINYSSTQARQQAVGDWDAVISLTAESRMLAKGQMTGSDGIATTATGTFTVQPEQNLKRIEIRTHSSADTELTIIAVRLTRVE